MKKTIILTIIFGTFCAFLIYKYLYHENMNIVVLGDSLATGETAYNVKGYSFNDYLKDYYEENSILKEYITEFTNAYETTETLMLKLQNNYTLESTGISITQAISKAKILTLALGMTELNNKNELKSSDIEKYLQHMEKMIKFLRVHNKKEFFVLSLYPSKKLSQKKVTEINQSLEKICTTYNVTFINIEDIAKNKENYFDSKNYHLNYKGHRLISEKIIDLMN